MGAVSAAHAFPLCQNEDAKGKGLYAAVDDADVVSSNLNGGYTVADEIVYTCLTGCNQVSRTGQSIHTNQLLLSASERGDINQIQEAFRNGAQVHTRRAHIMVVGGDNAEDRAQNQPVNSRRQAGMTPLMRASNNGHAEAVRLLLTHRADPLEQEEDGLTALHFAAMSGNAETCKVLIEAGAERHDLDDKGRCALDVVPEELVRTKSDKLVWESVLAPEDDLKLTDVN
mmetsp:Transcript_64377/g.119689  ORF Transcript_64377/g.119689 Transcript_64377/m.119689 type:complete len:228 (+) Transcript_64377:58-741(+)